MYPNIVYVYHRIVESWDVLGRKGPVMWADVSLLLPGSQLQRWRSPALDVASVTAGARAHQKAGLQNPAAGLCPLGRLEST